MFIDTHCHMSDEYYEDINQIILENEEAGIEKIIISGCEESEIEDSIHYINTYPNIYATIGYHPAEASKVTEENLIHLEKLITSNKKIVGIGEIGLDYHYGKEDILIQQKIFRKQLALAEKLHMPVVIHSRDATSDTIHILKEYMLLYYLNHKTLLSYSTLNAQQFYPLPGKSLPELFHQRCNYK